MNSPSIERMTAEEFYVFCHRPENRDRHFELHAGALVEMPAPGHRHGVLVSNLARILGNYAFKWGCGVVTAGNAGLILVRDPDTVQGADVAYHNVVPGWASLPSHYVDRVPELIVEVLSPHDRLGELTPRIERFLKQGTLGAWLVDPEDRTVTVITPHGRLEVLDNDESLEGPGFFPGLSIKVSDLFAMPGSQRA